MQERSFKDLQSLSFQTQFVILKLADFDCNTASLCVCFAYCLWFSILTALVESVQPIDIIFAHLSGPTQHYISIRNGHHSGLVVLGEGIPENK